MSGHPTPPPALGETVICLIYVVLAQLLYTTTMQEHKDNGLIKYKDTKTKCRLYWCLIEFLDCRYSQPCWYFLLSFMN
jgi:hypothetical protein